MSREEHHRIDLQRTPHRKCLLKIRLLSLVVRSVCFTFCRARNEQLLGPFSRQGNRLTPPHHDYVPCMTPSKPILSASEFFEQLTLIFSLVGCAFELHGSQSRAGATCECLLILLITLHLSQTQLNSQVGPSYKLFPYLYLISML